MPEDPSIGDEIEVIAECIGYGMEDIGVPCYILAGTPAGRCYDKRNFAILPGLDADEMEAIEQEAIVPNPSIV